MIKPHGLNSTFYETSIYPKSVIKRLSHGYFENAACAEYQPKCKDTWNAPIIGRDMRNDSVSWMQSAGGGISTPATWIAGCERSSAERWFRRSNKKSGTELVSMKTGEPIATISVDDPGGFALGLGKKILGPARRAMVLRG